MPGPDFPTGGIICGQQGILDGYRTRPGQDHPARPGRHRRGRQPQPDHHPRGAVPAVTRNRLARGHRRAGQGRAHQGHQRHPRRISSLRNGEPVRLVVYLKRDADPQLVLNQLYQFSPLEKTVSIILLALVDGRPRTLTLKQMLEEFLRHRVQVIRRRTEYLLREAKRRGHVLEGQLIAISSLDEVIQICRQSPSRAEAKTRLQDLEVAAEFDEPGPGRGAFRGPATRDRRATCLPHDRGPGRRRGPPAARPARRPRTRRDPQGIQRPARPRSSATRSC